MYKPMGATPTGPTLDPLNILVNKFNIATHVALILFYSVAGKIIFYMIPKVLWFFDNFYQK